MAAGAFTFYHVAAESLGNNTIDPSADVLKLALFTSTYSPSAADHVTFSALTNQVTGNGYTAGGETLAYAGTTRWAEAAGIATLDADDVVYTASGGSITARYAVLYSSTAAANNLIGYFLLDDTPADVTATDGNTLTVQWHTDGIFTLSVV